jgi:phosphate transport system substrate-binding protein
MNSRILKINCFLLFLVLVSACTNQPAAGKGELLKADTLVIWADTSLRVIVNEQKKAFENIYTNPVLSIIYMNENQIVKGLMSNKVNAAVLHRSLTANESALLESREDFLPRQYVFAYDAFVCIASDRSSFSSISMTDLLEYFTNNSAAKFSLAMENPNAQSIQFLKKKFSLQNEQLSRAYANKSLNDLLAYLRRDPNAIGIIPFAYISDIEAESTIQLLENLKVLPVMYKDSTQKTRLVDPSQETIATREYPLLAPVVFVNGNMENKSGTNFVNYLFKPRAQRLILRCGLCPAIFPGREVNIQTN